jgi:hypothetical protein
MNTLTQPSEFAALVQRFFTERLLQQQAASPRTVAAYRDAFRLLLGYAENQCRKSAAQLTLLDINADLIVGFLAYLEEVRHNTVRSRNARLAADVRPRELPLIQASRGQPDADPVVNQDLHSVGAPIVEQIGMVWVRGAEHLDHTRQGRVETGTHVQWIDRQPDLVDTNHRSHSRS